MLSSIQTLPRAHALSSIKWLHVAALLLVLCALWLTSDIAIAQEGKLSEADETALRTYALKAETVDSALKVVQDARRQQIKSNSGKDAKTLVDFATGLSADPKAKALLDKHQISARDYVMTMLALMRAGYASEAKPKTPEDAGTNAGNVAYVNANKARITEALHGGQSKAAPKAEPRSNAASK